MAIDGMKPAKSYRDSHVEPGKGAAYDEHYATSSWRRFLWKQEQHILGDFLDTYLKDQKIDLLDFACGTGRVTEFLEGRVETSTAVDVSREMLDVAEKKLKHTTLLQADLTRNNILHGREFNLITAFRFLLNAEPELRVEAVGTLASLLAKDGYMVFNNHNNRTSPLVWPKYVFHCRVMKREVRFLSIQEIRDLAAKAGLKIMRIYPVGLLSLPKTRFNETLSHRIDRWAMRFRFSGVLSESPIVVCRHRQ